MNQKRMRKPGRNYTVELWRFIFCIVVLGFHFCAKTNTPFLGAGYLAVEFFFVLSGYGIFFYYSKYMQGEKISMKWYRYGHYIGKRLLELYPLYLLSLIAMLLFVACSQKWNMSQLFAYMKNGWAEFFLFQCGPLARRVLIVPHWYVAALFWASLAVLFLLMIGGKCVRYVICPICAVVIYVYYYNLVGKIDLTYSYSAILRAAAGLMSGVFLGGVIDILRRKEISISKEKRKCLYVIGNLLFVMALVFMMWGKRASFDFFLVALLFVALFLTFLAGDFMDEKKKALFERLSSWTYPIYLFQMPVLELLFWVINK